jgi:hypothetical protein
MNVGKLHDAEAVERLRQPVQLDSVMFDAEHVGLGESRTSNMRQANSKRTQRGCGSLRTANGRDTSALVPSNWSRHSLQLGWRQPAGESAWVGRIIEIEAGGRKSGR